MENKTYYDWLEVSEKASKEVIEKAYKALVMKYHPDVQQESNGQYEDIIKKINEAYDVLSDNTKRAEYDAKLLAQSQEQNDDMYYYNQLENEKNYQSQIEAAKQKAYQDAYIQDMKNRGYKIRYKKSFKDYIRIAIIIIIILIVPWLIWQIPFVRNWINSIADNNFIIRIIVDIIRSIYSALFEAFFKF